jgi:hypothetical protein
MNPYAYGYLIGAVFTLLAWGLCYWLRPDLRREMLVMSGVAVAIGVPHEYLLWTRDWWRPPTLTGTKVGFEDVLYAIGTGGVLAALYPLVFRQNVVPGEPPPRWVAPLPLVLNFVLPLVLVPLVGLHSFVASAVGAGVALVWVFVSRPDLIVPAVINAVLGTAFSLPMYWIIEWFLPGFVAAVWDLPKLSGRTFTGIPIEDLVWYAYSAALFGVYYKYAVGGRLVTGVKGNSKAAVVE